MIEREITVFHAMSGDGEETKTVLKEGGQIWWMPEDAIKLFWTDTEQGRAGIEMVSNNAEASSSVDFICPASFDGNSASTFWAVYPSNTVESFSGESVVISIPSQQVAQEGTFANHFFPSVANSTDSYLRFYNVCGGIKFSVVRDDIKSVTFEGNNNEVLAGRVKLVIGNGGYPEVVEVLEGATSITLVAPDNGFFKPGKYYYLSVLPTKLQNGFSFRFNTTTQEDKLNSSDAKSIKRSVFGVLKEIDSRIDDLRGTIDLGTSVKWASFNLGATKPEEFGHYYAWGETEPNKTSYSWTSYKWSDGSKSNLNKYTIYDNKTALDVEDDAAHALLGEKWRMPTKEELQELSLSCSWTKKTVNGVAGYEGKSNYTGNTIFLPMCGVFRESEIKEIGQTGIYWSSDQANTKWKAESLYMMTNTSPQMGEDERAYGYSIRPVYGDPKLVSSVIMSQTSLTLSIGETANLTFTVSPSDALYRRVTWTTSNGSVATVSNGIVTANAEGKATITVTVGIVPYGPVKSATCSVTVNKTSNEQEEIPPFGTIMDSSGMGIVVWVSDDNRTGMLMSAEELHNEDWPSSNSWCESYGEGWRMPTIGELTLISNNYSQINNALKAGNYSQLLSEYFCYWSSTVNPSDSNYYYRERLNDGSVFKNTSYYEHKSSTFNFTRAVKTIVGDILVSSITLDKKEFVLTVGHSESLSATVFPDIATDKTVTWTSSNTSVATVSNGLVTAKAAGKVTITASAGSKSATCSVTVIQSGNGPEAVDLGLSVKWASYNVGASTPEENGDYFAWGEIEPKSEYSWSTYKWCSGSSTALWNV